MKKCIVAMVLLFQMYCSVGPDVKDGMTFGNETAAGKKITVHFDRGPKFIHLKRLGFMMVKITPQISLWMEDTLGNYLGTGYVTKSFGKQAWKWSKPQPDSCFRPMCMPYWLNRFKAAGNAAPTFNKPLPDAVCGATPTGGFTVIVSCPDSIKVFKVFAEWNSSFDNNVTFTKNKSSFNGQPPVIACAKIDLTDMARSVDTLKVIGRSGENSDDARLYTDVDKLTTALAIFGNVTVVRGN
jgi:hypothetical protein